MVDVRDREHRGRDVALVIAEEPVARTVGDLCRRRNYEVASAKTPLEAINALVSLGARVGVFVIAASAPWSAELTELVADEFPEIDQVITIA